jgi:hypothetical protein
LILHSTEPSRLSLLNMAKYPFIFCLQTTSYTNQWVFHSIGVTTANKDSSVYVQVFNSLIPKSSFQPAWKIMSKSVRHPANCYVLRGFAITLTEMKLTTVLQKCRKNAHSVWNFLKTNCLEEFTWNEISTRSKQIASNMSKHTRFFLQSVFQTQPIIHLI